MIVLPEAGYEVAKAIALRIGIEIEKGSFDGVRLTSSAGVAEWKPEFTTVEDFVSAVDQSLYLDKRGKNAA